MVSKLLINEYPLQVLPSLACEIGLNEAIILQQMHFWLNRKTAQEREGRYWVYNSYEGWREQLPFWGLNTIRRAIANLEKKGLLVTGNFNKFKGDKTKWYSINYDKLQELQEKMEEVTLSKKLVKGYGQTISPKWADGQPKMGSSGTAQNGQSSTIDPITTTERKKDHQPTNRGNGKSGKPDKEKTFTHESKRSDIAEAVERIRWKGNDDPDETETATP